MFVVLDQFKLTFGGVDCVGQKLELGPRKQWALA